MSSDKYVLNPAGVPVPEPDLIKWAMWFEKHENRRVAQDRIGDAKVSTVFLALDHNYGGGPPILWETTVFGGSLDLEQDRCAGSREQAEAMHAAMIERVKRAEVT